ncbi:MAG TPA: hypothetical protein VGI82_14415, partial [Chitinophagaceae bacterium]
MNLSKAPFFILALVSIFLYSCKKEYSYEGGLSSQGYLVKDSINNCSFISVAGNYKIGKKLTDSNFLQVEVHVTRAGQYAIITDQVNGYSFSASGNFKDTGILFVKLPADGKPLKAGTDLFNIQYDSSVCQAQVAVQDSLQNVVLTSNPDYFPLAVNNRWVYDDLSYPGDSVISTIVGDSTITGLSYLMMNEFISFYPVTNSFPYRKAGSAYLEYAAVSTFTDALDYAPTIWDDLPILKED